MPDLNVKASDCGSEGYGFKPRRPPHSKHETNGQDATGRDTAGTHKVPNRVPAVRAFCHGCWLWVWDFHLGRCAR
jgi:hypothetical protein